jgi:hypothetical protein
MATAIEIIEAEIPLHCDRCAMGHVPTCDHDGHYSHGTDPIESAETGTIYAPPEPCGSSQLWRSLTQCRNNAQPRDAGEGEKA